MVPHYRVANLIVRISCRTHRADIRATYSIHSWPDEEIRCVVSGSTTHRRNHLARTHHSMWLARLPRLFLPTHVERNERRNIWSLRSETSTYCHHYRYRFRRWRSNSVAHNGCFGRRNFWQSRWRQHCRFCNCWRGCSSCGGNKHSACVRPYRYLAVTERFFLLLHVLRRMQQVATPVSTMLKKYRPTSRAKLLLRLPCVGDCQMHDPT